MIICKLPKELPMRRECANIKPIRHLGLDAMQILKLAESFYCHNIRESLMVEVACPVVLGLGGSIVGSRSYSSYRCRGRPAPGLREVLFQALER